MPPMQERSMFRESMLDKSPQRQMIAWECVDIRCNDRLVNALQPSDAFELQLKLPKKKDLAQANSKRTKAVVLSKQKLYLEMVDEPVVPNFYVYTQVLMLIYFLAP